MKWEMKKLGEVCEIVNGGTPDTKVKEYWDGDLRWITPKDLGRLESDYVDETERKISVAGLKNSSAKMLPVDSVILSSRAPIGHLAINKTPISTNQGCKGLIPKKALDTKFLFYFLKGSVEYLNSLGTGTTFKELSGSKLATVEIPLPSIDEQRRIVAILDEAFAAIDKAKEAAQRNLQNAREVFEGYLQRVFENTGEGWEEKSLRQVAKHSLGKMLDKAKNQGMPQKYLRNVNVRWFGVDLSDLSEMRFQPSEAEKYTAQKGDLLICEGGYPGRAAIWEEDYPIYFQKALHRVRFHEPEYSRLFLYYLYLSSINGNLKNYFSGTGIQHFTGEALSRFAIPLPPKNLAPSIIAQLDNLATYSQQLQSIYTQKLAALEELKSAILQKAFAGGLTVAPPQHLVIPAGNLYS